MKILSQGKIWNLDDWISDVYIKNNKTIVTSMQGEKEIVNIVIGKEFFNYFILGFRNEPVSSLKSIFMLGYVAGKEFQRQFAEFVKEEEDNEKI